MKKGFCKILSLALCLVAVFSAVAFAAACDDESEEIVPPPPETCTVTVNGQESKVDKGGTFTLPQTFTPENADFEFVRWIIEGEHALDGNVITVNGDLTITAETRRKAAVKIKDGIPLAFTVGDDAKTITVSEYITTHGNTVTVNSSEPTVAAVSISGDTVTVEAAAHGTASVTVSCGDIEITFAVTVSEGQIIVPIVPSVKNPEVEISETHDFYNGNLTVNLAENIERPELITSYTVNSQEVQGGEYTLTSNESYTDTPTLITLNVTAEYKGGSLTYAYKVNVINSAAYRVENGGFDKGLNGWTKTGEIGNISEATAYWTNENDGAGYSFNADGKFFSAYEPEDKFERNIGALVSSPFKIAQNRVITFKLGGAKHDIFVDIVDTADGAILARYGNSAWAETTTDGVKCGCTLIAYKAVLPQAAAGKTAYIRVIDMASSDYGVLFCDSFVTFYENEPEGEFAQAVEITDRPATIYDIYNGDFEKGNLDGWIYEKTNGLDFGRIVSEDYYWGNEQKEFNKQGTYLFSGVETVAGSNQEGGMGTLKSSIFMLKANGWISFRMGGSHNAHTGIRIRTPNGDILAEFNNLGKGFESVMDLYKYKFIGMTEEIACYIEIYDFAASNWGLVTADDFRTDWGDTEPTDGTAIIPVYVKGQTQVYNGGFDNGADGWEIITTEFAPETSDAFAFVNNTQSPETWGDENVRTPYNNEGAFLQNGNEGAKGYALSSAFEVSENGWITFMLGGNKAFSYMAIVDADTGEELAKFVNEDYKGDWPTKGWELHSYKANLLESGIVEGRRVRIKLVDNAGAGDYGVIVADSFITQYGEEPSSDNFKKIDKVTIA